MRKTEMKKAMEAGTTVAIGRSFSRDEYPTSARKAVITGLNAKRRVHSGARHDIRGHITEDGVRVLYERPVDSDRYHRPVRHGSTSYTRGDEHEETDECVVGPREVIDTWEDFERKCAEVAARRRAGEQRALDARETCQRLAAALTEAGFRAEADYHVPQGEYLGSYRGVRLAPRAAQALVEALGNRSVA